MFKYWTKVGDSSKWICNLCSKMRSAGKWNQNLLAHMNATHTKEREECKNARASSKGDIYFAFCCFIFLIFNYNVVRNRNEGQKMEMKRKIKF